MWSCSSNASSGSATPRKDFPPNQAILDVSDDEVSSPVSRHEGLECPICWESFNIVENVPYVLWCGHTLCKDCVLGLQRAVLKFKNLPIQLPLFISCPWCHLLSLRLLYKGNLKFPRKNFFLLWMVESMNGIRERSYSSFCPDRQPVWPSSRMLAMGDNHQLSRVSPSPNPGHSHPTPNRINVSHVRRIQSFLRKLLAFFAQLLVKVSLIFVLLIVLYAVPANATILALYFLFACHSLNWLVREIMS